MIKRKVEIVIDPEQLDITQNAANIKAAIGHLAMWAIGSERYKDVSIWSGRDRELVATYRDDKGSVTYVIGAVEREDGTYSFHS